MTEEQREAIRAKRAADEAEELRLIRAKTQQALLRKAGLAGDYAKADCELGRRLYSMAMQGQGAYLFGSFGTGKTYAAACAVRGFVLNGKRAKLTTTTALLQSIRDEFGDNRRDANVAFNRAKMYDLLALDDFGMEKRTEWSIEQLEALLNARYETGKPTIITSNYRVGELRDMWGKVPGGRLASRICGMCERIEVTGEDRRLIARW